MRWRGRKQSSNIEDRRGQHVGGFSRLGAGAGRGGGIFRLLPLAIKFLGFKGTLVAVGLLFAASYFGGFDLMSLLGGAPTTVQNPPGRSTEVQQSAAEKELAQFVSVVLADTEETWHQLFQANGQRYQEPRLVLYRDAVQSACGLGQAAMGPFYCPADKKVYLDLSFFDDLKRRHNAPGDFAQAYVIAHEVGHHVQTLLGISGKVRQAQQRLSKTEANKLSVKLELQADCFAGIWGHHARRSRQLLESGDIEEGLNAASAIGDDRLQKKSNPGGRIVPESFTHGTSAQRMHWFQTGLKQGSVSACNTFASR